MKENKEYETLKEITRMEEVANKQMKLDIKNQAIVETAVHNDNSLRQDMDVMKEKRKQRMKQRHTTSYLFDYTKGKKNEKKIEKEEEEKKQENEIPKEEDKTRQNEGVLGDWVYEDDETKTVPLEDLEGF